MKDWKARRRHGGFTLAETMMTVLILVMVGTILTAGVPTAVHAYERVVDGANAQLLLSTTVSRLEEELSTAVEVWTKSGTQKVTAYSHYQNGYKIALVNGTAAETAVDSPAGAEPTDTPSEKGLGLVYLQRYKKDANDPDVIIGYVNIKTPKNTPLVTGKTATEKFYVKTGENADHTPDITYDKDSNTFTVNGLEVLKKDGDVSVVKLDEPLVIRTVKTPACPPLDYD